MINECDIIDIGQFNRPHGIKGEINATIDENVDPDLLKCLILDMDGIYTPFFIDSWRPKSASTILLTIDGIESDSQAATLNNKRIYITKSDAAQFGDEPLDDGQFYLEDLIGFEITDTNESFSGEISAINDSTANILFEIETSDGKVLLIPAVDEYICDIDETNRKVIVDLPEGFLQM